MAGSLEFDYWDSSQLRYANPNIWFSENQPKIKTNPLLGTLHIDKGGETDELEAGKKYWIGAAVRNHGTITGSVTLRFFLCDAGPMPRLSTSHWPTDPSDPTLDPPPAQTQPNIPAQGWALFIGGQYLIPLDVSPGNHPCLVCVIDDGSAESDYYLDDKRKPKVDKLVNLNDRVIAQHNVQIAAFATSGSGINRIGYFSIYGHPERTPCSLILRTPDGDELPAIRELLGSSVNVRAVCDVTAETRVGLFESEPGYEAPVGENELHELPIRVPVEGLEPYCERKLYLGIKLPNSGGKSGGVSVAFTLMEQVTERGELLGGILIIALSW
ncbi:hypothetical protein FOYG_16973 [Fusarium oxysporum NRRL 32931]|uniref:Uncharacterized protein n=1 Tax=Fusarium oxysporum NRRL 32931 TaxID=660029 RepID=W9HBJ9_FUSOX|nr:hypothetical protein FOYG_16973 [Fusarium oxysporum NRRL 32931]